MSSPDHGQSCNSPQHGHHAAAKKQKPGPGKDLSTDLGIESRKGAHSRSLPAGVDREPVQYLKENEGPSIFWIGEWAKASLPYCGRNRVVHLYPARDMDRVERDQDGCDAESPKLNEVRDDD